MTRINQLRAKSVEELKAMQEALEKSLNEGLSTEEADDAACVYNLISRVLFEKEPYEIEPFDLGDYE